MVDRRKPAASSSSAGTGGSAAASPNPRTSGYEWGGPMGAMFNLGFLPLVVGGLNAACDRSGCAVAAWRELPARLVESVADAWDLVPWAVAVQLLWIGAHAAFYMLPVGRLTRGTRLRNGETLTYRINGLQAMVVSFAVAFAAHTTGAADLTVLADRFFPLALGAMLIATVLAIAVYAASFRPGRVLLALGGNTGNPVYDFWVGRELNPRIGGFDLKFMCELRPGLIGWALLLWAFVLQAAARGALSAELVLVAVFQTGYVVDALWFEAGNTTMMDITTDGFGFMLAFGDLAWVPFLYTLQAKFLSLAPAAAAQRNPAMFPVGWSAATERLIFCAMMVGFQAGGYALFRLSNLEKDRFRSNPADGRVAHLRTMPTKRGTRLIVSGCWGFCRHPNYVGDWLMTVAQSGLCGAALVPWFQPIYFGILLVHRQLRDEAHMRQKYGDEDWAAFCRKVPYRMIPYVY